MHIEVPWEKMKGRYYGYAQGEQIWMKTGNNHNPILLSDKHMTL
jgi:hypothetical protein